MKNRSRIRAVMKQDLISPAFRERLMLAVTAVSGCRYCSYVHAREALLAGVPETEMESLLSGVVDDCPGEEIAAVFYAQHWAETDANPDSDARQKLVEVYGDDIAGDIELVLRMIWMGSLMGNAWDYLLYRISFGRWGL
jgi:AhpD family alkylhydroperoxidase